MMRLYFPGTPKLFTFSKIVLGELGARQVPTTENSADTWRSHIGSGCAQVLIIQDPGNGT